MKTATKYETEDDLRNRITQLEWEVEKLLDIKPKAPSELTKLSEPLKPEEIEWRVGRSGLNKDGSIWAVIVPYINARSVMDRLDAICGISGWQDAYTSMEGGFMCTLMIMTDQGWISKSDGAPQSDIEGFKGGFSDSLKRAAVKWGIGRELYNYPEVYAEIVEKNTPGAHYAKTKENTVFYWRTPEVIWKE